MLEGLNLMHATSENDTFTCCLLEFLWAISGNGLLNSAAKMQGPRAYFDAQRVLCLIAHCKSPCDRIHMDAKAWMGTEFCVGQ